MLASCEIVDIMRSGYVVSSQTNFGLLVPLQNATTTVLFKLPAVVHLYYTRIVALAGCLPYT